MFRVAVLFIWHFNCAYSCRVRVKVPDFRPLQNAVAEQTRRGVSILEQQVTALRQDSNKHFEAIREKTNQFFENALDRLTKAQESFTNELVPQLLRVGNETDFCEEFDESSGEDRHMFGYIDFVFSPISTLLGSIHSHSYWQRYHLIF